MKWFSGFAILLLAGFAAFWVFTLPKSPPSAQITKQAESVEIATNVTRSSKESVAEPVAESVTQQSPVELNLATSQGGEASQPAVAKSGAVENSPMALNSDTPGQRPAPREERTGQRPIVRVEAEIGREAYNALTELKALIDSQSWEDAARLITSLDARSATGVAPFVNDQTLLTSVAVAAELVFEDYPQVRGALDEKYAALGKLRVAQATAAGDVPRLELATVQFAGTPAAEEAHLWLGDRALAAGFFARAIWHYERAADGQPETGVEVGPRIRLAAAMLGREAGRQPTSAVAFGQVSISPAEFEALVAEMRKRGKAINPVSTTSVWPVPKPGRFVAQLRGKLEGSAVERPREEVVRRANLRRSALVDRQLGTAVEDGLLYVASHFHIAAFRLTNGERVWQGEKPPGHVQRVPEWAGVPMRPLIAGDRVFVRLLYSGGPQLTCYEKASGKLLWVAESREREPLVSDPLLIDGELVALSFGTQPDQNGELKYCQFDVRTGEVLQQRELVRLGNRLNSRSGCQIAEAENGLVATLAGATMAVDGTGEVRWIRTYAMTSADDETSGRMQMPERPLVDDGRVYVAQPGVRTVECLAARTGRKYWSTEVPDVVGILGLAGDLLLVRTEVDLRALSADDGSERWRYSADSTNGTAIVDQECALVACRERVPNSADQWQIGLRWLNLADGMPIGASVIAGLHDDDPWLGPLVPYQDRIFTFFGRGQYDATRELVELAPGG